MLRNFQPLHRVQVGSCVLPYSCAMRPCCQMLIFLAMRGCLRPQAIQQSRLGQFQRRPVCPRIFGLLCPRCLTLFLFQSRWRQSKYFHLNQWQIMMFAGPRCVGRLLKCSPCFQISHAVRVILGFVLHLWLMVGMLWSQLLGPLVR